MITAPSTLTLPSLVTSHVPQRRHHRRVGVGDGDEAVDAAALALNHALGVHAERHDGELVGCADGVLVGAVGAQRAHHEGRQVVTHHARVDGVAARQHAEQLVEGLVALTLPGLDDVPPA
eukprot:1331183-Prymnesium_polylepis.1